MTKEETIQKCLTILHSRPVDFKQFTVEQMKQSELHYVRDNTYSTELLDVITNGKLFAIKEEAQAYANYLTGNISTRS
jgi:hypothetical protein